MNLCGITICNANLFYPSSPLRTYTIKEFVFNVARRRPNLSLVHDVHALRDLNLTVGPGERVGIVGPNGSGKSTLLKAVAGVYPLQSGHIEVTGRTHGLFELSLGFEADATGRDNIMYRGLLLGETPASVRAKVKEIVEFADLGEFIDYPIRAYSAGMLVRLAFSISTAFVAEILLLDEVLGAGDAAFMQRATARLSGLIRSSHILMLVSHDLNAIKAHCNRAVLMNTGRIVLDGSPEEVCAAYQQDIGTAG